MWQHSTKAPQLFDTKPKQNIESSAVSLNHPSIEKAWGHMTINNHKLVAADNANYLSNPVGNVQSIPTRCIATLLISATNAEKYNIKYCF